MSSWPCVASRRLSWATTRCTAARSWIGPLGSARSSSLSGRLGGSARVRSISARSSSRRSCCSKPAAGRGERRRGARVVLGQVRAAARCAGRARGGCAGRRRRARRSPRRGAEGGDRQPREVAHRAPPAPSRIAAAICWRSASRSMLGRPPVDGPRRLGDALRGRLGLGGAEEEAIEHELEHAAVVGRLGERRGERLLEVRVRGPLTSSSARERVEQLGGADRDALAAQLLGEADQLRVESPGDQRALDAAAPGAIGRSLELDADARGDGVEIGAVLDDHPHRLAEHVCASRSSAPSSSSARAQSIDSAIDGGFLRSSSRTSLHDLDELARDRLVSSGVCRRTISARARRPGSRATGTGSGA